MPDECERCGACCIYFNVRDSRYALPEDFHLMGVLPPRIVKPAGEPCQHLKLEDGIASCAVYNSPERWEQCGLFSCHHLFRPDAQEAARGLEETRREIREGKFALAIAE